MNNNVNVELRCIHRHTIDEHPACFAKGKIKYDFRDDREWERKTSLPWYTFPGYKIGYLDIEGDNLKANFGNMLSWAIKDKGGDIHHDIITREELFSGEFDERIVTSLVEKMKEYKILVTYYGTGFDIPYIRSKALFYGMEFPGYEPKVNHAGSHYYRSEIYHFDLYYTVRSKLQLHRNSLAVATEYLGIEGKTPIKGEVWRRAKFGDPEALEEVLEHNDWDVIITEKLHDKLEPFRKWSRRGI